MSTAPSGSATPRSLFKSMLQGSTLYTIAFFGQRVASLVLLPITTRYLTPSDYGITDLLEQVSAVVSLHNILAALLVINAALSLFYHLATERMREYIPRPYGFFDDAIVQAKYYVRGIFKGEPHPFEKRPDSRMNPIQKFTYFAILLVLLPLQILSGALMWGLQRWPAISGWFGGLPSLAPFHSLVAWLFAAFIVVHVYMTTTGSAPLEAARAMVTGWEEVEVHEHEEEESEGE